VLFLGVSNRVPGLPLFVPIIAIVGFPAANPAPVAVML